MPSRPASVRSSHPLLGVFPLAVMALAAGLVAFTLMMARLTSTPSTGPGLPATASASVVLAPGARVAPSTRTSGAVTSAPSAVTGGARTTAATSGVSASPAPATISTRTSGAGRVEGGRDE
jgi:hypothetical protein